LRDQGRRNQPRAVGGHEPHRPRRQRQRIAPGVVDGERWDHVDAIFARYDGLEPGEPNKQVGAGVPFGRMATAADLSCMAAFLASPDADDIVAKTCNVEGGQWMS